MRKQPDYNDFDAVVHRVTGLDVNQLHYRDFEYTITPNDRIEITDDITFMMMDPVQDKESGIVKRESCVLWSMSQPIAHLRSWIKHARTEYEAARTNKLGDDLYYFDQTPVENANAGKALSFVRERFITNRRLTNVFFEEKEEISARLNQFQHDHKWFADRGIPRTLGFMLYGDPGCGKTSLIKAIAHECRRHIINVRFSGIRTNAQLRNLFCNPVIQVVDPTTQLIEKVTIPISRRLFVIEDIDAMTDLVKKREYKAQPDIAPVPTAPAATPAVPAKRPARQPARYPDMSHLDGEAELEAYFRGAAVEERNDMADEQKREENHDKITLDSILNIMDGTLEIPDRILFITTNHPAVIDPALIRPGRIDAIIHFKKANRQVMREMFTNFYGTEFSPEAFCDVREYVVSPAELNQIMFRFMRNPSAALKHLQGLA